MGDSDYHSNAFNWRLHTMTSKWEVQEFCLFGGWTNNWRDDDEPTRFDSESDALACLDEFLNQMQDEANDGNLMDAPDRNSFRIREV
jgi:hypothetical protein